MEPADQPQMSDKVWNIVQVFLFMLKTRISKNKMILDLQHLMMKRGKVVRKSLEHLVLNNTSSFSCKPNDAHLSFVSPREYEFSCSNTPAYPLHHVSTKRKHKRRHQNEELRAVNGVRKMFEMLNNEEQASKGSPLVFPLERQLRITDSPFPLGGDSDQVNSHVDKEAEDFIQSFYEQLRQQQMMAVWEGRNQNTWARKTPG